ncbi:PGA [Symbiodinium sp. CCMP2456]|nr:PGA [Symbiodinium sp. CCMP2456]
MIWLLLSLLWQAASGHQSSQVPKLRRANGTIAFNAWTMLDPASSQAFERTQNLRVHEFLSSYVRMYKAGKAQDLMPDPFVDAPSLEGLTSKGGQLHDARALAEQLRGSPSAAEDAVQLPCRFEEDHDYIGVDALTIPHRPGCIKFASECLLRIPYFEVSALQFLRVHKVFREMVENIILQPQLWSSDSLKEFYQKHKQQTILQDQCVLS